MSLQTALCWLSLASPLSADEKRMIENADRWLTAEGQGSEQKNSETGGMSDGCV